MKPLDLPGDPSGGPGWMGQKTTRELTAAQKIVLAEQMMTIEERMSLEKAAREAKSPGVNQYTSRSPAGPQETKPKGVDEVARQIAKRAGTGVRSVYDSWEKKLDAPKIERLLPPFKFSSMTLSKDLSKMS